MTNKPIILILPDGRKEDLIELILEAIEDKKEQSKDKSDYIDSLEASKIMKYKSVRSFYNFASRNKLKKHFFSDSSKPLYLKEDILKLIQH